MHPICVSPARPRRPAGDRAERGIVFIWVLMCVLVISGIVYTAVGRMRSMDQLASVSFDAHGRARQVATAGLSDALAWFRRMSQQPVKDFVPWRDGGAPQPPYLEGVDGAPGPQPSKDDAEPPINDTEDSTIGLVRTFEIAPGLWGRYSVIRGIQPEKYKDKNKNGFYDAGDEFQDKEDRDGDGVWTPGSWTRDVSRARGIDGEGVVWLLVSRGQVFRRVEAHLDLDEGRNHQVASVVMATEIRRLSIELPAKAALMAGRGDGVRLEEYVRVQAKTALAYTKKTGKPKFGKADVTGSNAEMDPFRLSVKDIFGVSWLELASMADVSADGDMSGLPVELPAGSLSVISGDVTFDADHPLRGSGVIAVRGNVQILSGSNSRFEGVLYVDGDLTIAAPCEIRGSVAATGKLEISGTKTAWSEVIYDKDALKDVLKRLGQYRQSKAVYAPLPTLPDGRPNEAIASPRRLGDDPYPGGYTPPIPPSPKPKDLRELYKKVSGQ